jgi:hypothetical protein
LFFSLDYSHVGITFHIWRSVAGLHRILCRASASDDCLAGLGNSLLSLDLVPQSRSIAVVDGFLCGDDECFGFGDIADIVCSIFAVDKGAQSFDRPLTIYAA